MEPDSIDRIYSEIITEEISFGKAGVCLLSPEASSEDISKLLTEINESNYRIL